MESILFTVASFFLWNASLAVHSLAIALVGSFFGMRVKEVEVGYGPLVWKRECRRFGTFRFSAIPICSATRFWTTDDIESPQADGYDPESGPGTFYSEAPPAMKVMTIVAGPMSVLCLGVLFVAVPVWHESPRLEASVPTESDVHPCGVPGLRLSDEASTWASHLVLLRETAVELLWRVVTFQELDYWGGPIALLLTSGRVGQLSCMAWHSFVGILLTANALFNLLPIPGSVGFQLLNTLLRWAGWVPFSERTELLLVVVGVLGMYAVILRLAWLDLWWLGELVLRW